MSLSLALVISPQSQPHVRISQWQAHEPVGVVEIDGMTMQASRPCDLENLGKALIECAEKLTAAQVNWASAQEAPSLPLTVGAETPEREIRCARCLEPLTDDDTLVRVPFFVSGEANVAHETCHIPTCRCCGTRVTDWPSKDCEEPEEHAGAVYDCDCGDAVTMADALAHPSKHRRCNLIGSRS